MKRRGFTLIEIMITVAIIGVLAAIAVPAYTGYTKKAKMQKIQVPMESIAAYLDNLLAEGNLTSLHSMSGVPRRIRKGISRVSGYNGFDSDNDQITISISDATHYRVIGKLNGYSGSIMLNQNGTKWDSGDQISWIK